MKMKHGLLFNFTVIALAVLFTLAGCDTGNTPDSGPSYTEGDVYVSSLSVMMHYYFSSTPEGIEKAAYDNGVYSINPPIKNAPWTLNTTLEDNVKNAMDSRGVSYSAAVYNESGTTYVVVNRKANGSWYITIYTLT